LPASSPAYALPLPPGQRDTALDKLRGVAVLGILPINMQLFAMPYAALGNPLVWGSGAGLNGLAWWVFHLFFELKFLTLFALLFGAGLQMVRERLGQAALQVHRRRMAALMVIGLLHAYAVWYGDILFYYACCGWLLWPVTGLGARALALLGVVLLCIPPLSAVVYWWLLPWLDGSYQQQLQQHWQPGLASLLAEIAAYRGDWLAQLPERAHRALTLQAVVFPLQSGWRIAGSMCLGMALYRAGWLQAARWRAHRGAAWLMLAAGVGLTAWGAQANWQDQWAAPRAPLLGTLPLYWGSLLVAGGYLGLVLPSGGGWLSRGLEALGRTALSNYLLQSLVCYLLFHGSGLGLMGRLDRAALAGLVPAIWALQLTLTALWLRYCRRGPVEAVLRRVAYRS